MKKVEQVKKESDIRLEGICVQITKGPSGILDVTLTDGAGSFVRFDSSRYDSLTAYVPAPRKMVLRYVVEGTVFGSPFLREFDSRAEAQSARNDMADSLDASNISVEVKEREVESED